MKKRLDTTVRRIYEGLNPPKFVHHFCFAISKEVNRKKQEKFLSTVLIDTSKIVLIDTSKWTIEDHSLMSLILFLPPSLSISKENTPFEPGV